MSDDFGNARHLAYLWNPTLIYNQSIQIDGDIEQRYDEDWFAINLEKGHQYKFELNGDLYLGLGLYNSSGYSIAGIYGKTNQYILREAEYTGVYYIRAEESFSIPGTGEYTLKVTKTSTNPIPDDDFHGSAGTTRSLLSGRSIQGHIERPYDQDWFRLSLNTNTNYTFTIDRDTLPSSSIYLVTENGGQYDWVHSFADPVTNTNQFSFKPSIWEESDNLYLKVTNYFPWWSHTGTYTVSLTDQSTTQILNDIAGTPLNDTIVNTKNDDVIDGLEGVDTVSYDGEFDNYKFSRNINSLDIEDQRLISNDGSDTLLNIEYIQFADQKVEESKVDVHKTYSGNFSDYKFYNIGNGTYQIKIDARYEEYEDITGYPLITFAGEETTSSFRDISAIVDIKGTFDQITGLNTDDAKMFRLYNASFKRLPDPDGLQYWIGKYSSGENDERAVASSFLVSDEFKERYGENVSDSTYVNNLYKNVLGRDADTSGLNYWLGQLNTGAETRYEVLLGFSESAENKTLFTEMTGFG